MTKRALDLFLCLLLMIPVLPVLLLAAIAIRIDSRGPVFYRQTRIGLDGTHFGMLKLRSMVTDADRIGGYSTASDDPRITKVGRFLRRTSLDELPQILNVLKGEMSFVGPRPDVPAQKSLYSEADFAKRVSVLPGITGLAQATKRSSAVGNERIELDLRYVRERSLMLDLKILWWTATRLFSNAN